MVLLASGTDSVTGIVRVLVKGIDPQQGRLVVYLFQEQAGLPPSPDLIFAGSSTNDRDSTVTVPFLGVPYGTYALLAFQDTDGNGVPAVNPSSAAVEPFCYSRPHPVSPSPEHFGSEAAPEENRPGTEVELSEFQRIAFLHQRDETVVELILSPARPGGSGRPEGMGRPGGSGAPGGAGRPR